MVVIGKLPLADHVCHFNTGDRRWSGMKRLEPQYMLGNSFDEAMTLFKDVIEIFNPKNFDHLASACDFQDIVEPLWSRPSSFAVSFNYRHWLSHSLAGVKNLRQNRNTCLVKSRDRISSHLYYLKNMAKYKTKDECWLWSKKPSILYFLNGNCRFV